MPAIDLCNIYINRGHHALYTAIASAWVKAPAPRESYAPRGQAHSSTPFVVPGFSP